MKQFKLKLILSISLLALGACERPEPTVEQTSVERILSTLSSDEMMGRRAFTPGAEMAADYIAEEFAAIGLDHFGGLEGYQQTFPVYSVTAEDSRVVINGREIPAERFALSVSAPTLNWTADSDVNVVVVGSDDNPMQALMASRSADANTLVLFNRRHERMFARIRRYVARTSRTLDLETATSTVYALTNVSQITSLEVDVTGTVEQLPLTNVVGVIPGKRSEEYVLFGAHHDHMGIVEPVDGDSIANGANDNAAGVTAVIELARYFKQRRRPTRTLIFVAFAAEEMGMYGSQYLSSYMRPETIVAMFNIEMIGKAAASGPNSAYITGFDRSDFGEILQQTTEGTSFSFLADPYTEMNLFFRSDNAPFARLGVPAHTIGTTAADDEDVHQVTDEIETLDVALMTNTIQAIARAAVPIVAGEATPTRIDIEELNQ
jgi:hypothetical protein